MQSAIQTFYREALFKNLNSYYLIQDNILILIHSPHKNTAVQWTNAISLSSLIIINNSLIIFIIIIYKYPSLILKRVWVAFVILPDTIAYHK